MMPLQKHDQSEELQAFRDLIERETGLDMSKRRDSALLESAAVAFQELGFGSLREGLDALSRSGGASDETLRAFARHFTVGESYFFRDSTTFQTLQNHILPSLIEKRRIEGKYRLRIWSAGCSSGEEPYSIAAALRLALPDFEKWDIAIVGTDINSLALEKATKGEFGEWSFRGVSEWFKKTCFKTIKHKKYKIDQFLKERTQFHFLNLINESDMETFIVRHGDSFDIILCQNVLMYFKPTTASRVVERFAKALGPHGWLFLSPLDISLTNGLGLAPSSLGDRFLRRKTTANAAAPFESLAAPARFQPNQQATISENKVPAKILPPTNFSAKPLVKIKEVKLSDPISFKALMQEAWELANKGDLKAALSRCEQAIQNEKSCPKGHYLRAIILQEQGKENESRDSFQRVLFLDKDFAPAHVALGNMARSAGDKIKASKHFQNALAVLEKRNPDDILPELDGMSARDAIEIIQMAASQ